MVITQGDVCWADLPDPTGSGPGFRRPVVVVQGDAFNRSRIATVVCVPLTSNLRWADAPGGSNGDRSDSDRRPTLGKPMECNQRLPALAALPLPPRPTGA